MKQIELSKSISAPGSRLSRISKLLRQNWLDILLITLLVVAVGGAAYIGANLISPAFSLDKQTSDAWFHTDATRVFDDMAVYEADHYRTNLHPLFVLLVLPFVSLVKIAFGLEAITAVRIALATSAALWGGLLFLVLRLIGCRQLDATLFSILAAISSAAMFWFTIPETYAFGSVTILLAIFLAALAKYRRFSPLWYVIVGALTLSVTVTNWMAGIFATIINHRWKQSVLISVKSFALVAILVIVQKIIIPSSNAGFLRLLANVTSEKDDILIPDNSGPIQVFMKVVKAFMFDTIVMPNIYLAENVKFPTWSRMTVEYSLPGSASLWGYIAVAAWVGLLSLGIWGIFSNKDNHPFRIVLGLTLVGQLLLHMLYGSDKAFLYTLHFLPLLVILAAFSTLTPARGLALLLTGVLIITAAINNSLQFGKAADFSYGKGPLCAIQSAKCGVVNDATANLIGLEVSPLNN